MSTNLTHSCKSVTSDVTDSCSKSWEQDRITSNAVDNTNPLNNKKGFQLYTLLSRAILAAFALTLVSCQSVSVLNIPDEQTTPSIARPNIPLETGYGYDSNALGTAPTSMASIRWQSFYRDQKLQTLIRMGLENNKDIKQAILAIQRARAQYRVTDKQDLPTVNSATDYTRSANNRADANGSSNYGVNLATSSYELDFWGRINSLEEQALQDYLATSAAKDSVQISLIANIATSYVNLSYQLQQLALAEKTRESRQESLYITQARLNAGIDAKTPSLQAAASVETAHIAVLEAQTAVRLARNALEYLVGAPLPPELLPAPAVKNIIDQNMLSAGLPSELLRYRPDILQAEYQLKAAGANIDAARAAYFPNISLTGRFGYSSGDLSGLFNSSALGWSFGPSVNIPIFDGGQLEANYEVANIERDQAIAKYESTIEAAFRDVNDVLAKRATLEERTAAQYRLQDNYSEIHQITEARFINQVDDYLSVLDAQRVLFSTQQSILRLEQEQLENQIDLYRSLGGGANLVEPIAIPIPQYPNLVDIVNPAASESDEEKAERAIQAASSAVFVTDREAQDIESQGTIVLIEQTELEPVDINEDNRIDAYISEVETTVLPAGTTVMQTDNGIAISEPDNDNVEMIEIQPLITPNQLPVSDQGLTAPIAFLPAPSFKPDNSVSVEATPVANSDADSAGSSSMVLSKPSTSSPAASPVTDVDTDVDITENADGAPLITE